MGNQDSFIEGHLGLVHLCANRFRGRGIEYDDLFSAGSIGLVKAAAAFDSSRGFKFSSYAVPVILGEIKRLFRDGGSIKVSRGLKELSIKVSRERERFTMEKGHEPRISELAEALEVSEESVKEALAVSLPPISLTPDDESGNGQLDVPVPAHEERIGDLLALRTVMAQLPAADRKLLYLRYFQNKTQSQTAQCLSMTQVQVSRREKKLLAAIRETLLE